MLGPSLLIVAALAFQAPEPPPTRPSGSQAEARLRALLTILAPETTAPASKPAKPQITDAEVRLRDLEARTQGIRDEVRQQLADAAVVPEQGANEAKKAWDDAILARKAAEAKVQEYINGTLPQDVQTCKGEVSIAEFDLERAQAQFDWRQKAVDERREVAGALLIADRLGLQRAEFEVEAAKTQLNIQERYLGPKETKRLEALVAAAADEEQIKKQHYDRQADQLRKRQAEGARLQARTPEDLVVAILDDVVKREGRIVDLTRELAAIRAEQAADPDHPAAYLDRIEANRDAVANTARQIKEDLTLATTVAEEARQARDRLFKAEKRLIVARREVEREAK